MISFCRAVAFHTSQQAVLVKDGNTEITGIDSLDGQNVATQSGSTGPSILAEYAPDAIVQEFEDDIQARTAVEQGRADAYVTDYTLILNSIVKNPGVYAIAGDVFGPVDPYGIGLSKDSDGVAFVNTSLQTIIDDGTWAKTLADQPARPDRHQHRTGSSCGRRITPTDPMMQGPQALVLRPFFRGDRYEHLKSAVTVR